MTSGFSLTKYFISCLLYLDYQKYISMIVGNLLYKVTDSIYSFKKENILFPFFYGKSIIDFFFLLKMNNNNLKIIITNNILFKINID